MATTPCVRRLGPPPGTAPHAAAAGRGWTGRLDDGARSERASPSSSGLVPTRPGSAHGTVDLHDGRRITRSVCHVEAGTLGGPHVEAGVRGANVAATSRDAVMPTSSPSGPSIGSPG